MNKNLIVFFSATSATKQVALALKDMLDADIHEIQPREKYTSEDLNWMNKNSRSSIEMNDKKFRPEIVKDNIDIQKYDTIFLGFPIWWYVAPTIINTFLEQHNFANKTIVLFATSGGSSFGETVKYLTPSVDKSCNIIVGNVFRANISQNQLKNWVETLNI